MIAFNQTDVEIGGKKKKQTKKSVQISKRPHWTIAEDIGSSQHCTQGDARPLLVLRDAARQEIYG